jgi:hypothetical protein
VISTQTDERRPQAANERLDACVHATSLCRGETMGSLCVSNRSLLHWANCTAGQVLDAIRPAIGRLRLGAAVQTSALHDCINRYLTLGGSWARCPPTSEDDVP